jgi:ferric-dicitrate binding protein FerR (iron transport regulator)
MDETILLNYLQGECNDEEAARVETWCEEEPGNRKTLEQLYYTLFVGERIAVMNAVDTEASLDKFKSAIREKERKISQSVGGVMLLWLLLFLPDLFLPVELPGDYFPINFQIMR